ncbi:hypothetical protein REC12_15205 [Desulfosporosinus sp. PR]|uniref:hypothetical protein n=1 Tax=Candidatus Desulfosporosinus nitrosoreducens TaxID=3401928 RepID=UPI0027EE1040|nr:hypothetical protein [Desulfosporosinus sp. PR]MDQ7094943.1 hypothetical protein [Desulfosporosinus sp. PR]
MLSFSSFVFSWRMRLSKLKHHKLAVSLGGIILLFAIIMGPPCYEESWLDPFSTLNVANRELHPHSITMIGLLNSDDPFHPYYYANKGKISELMHNLQRSTPLSSSEIPANTLDNLKIEYFTLHRASSKYHDEEDYALQYYPDKGIVRFGQQLFRVNEATIYTFTQISTGMTPGWWQ